MYIYIYIYKSKYCRFIDFLLIKIKQNNYMEGPGSATIR